MRKTRTNVLMRRNRQITTSNIMYVKRKLFITAIKKWLKEQGLSLNKEHPALCGDDNDPLYISDEQAVRIGLKKE